MVIKAEAEVGLEVLCMGLKKQLASVDLVSAVGR